MFNLLIIVQHFVFFIYFVSSCLCNSFILDLPIFLLFNLTFANSKTSVKEEGTIILARCTPLSFDVPSDVAAIL